jgi:hypothetical protein
MEAPLSIIELVKGLLTDASSLGNVTTLNVHALDNTGEFGTNI